MSAISKRYKSGEVLFTEGDKSSSIFILKSGAVSIRKATGTTFTEVARIKANEVIGELSFFDRLPRSATGIALMEVELVEIAFEDLEKIYNNIPDYMKSIMATLATRLRESNEQLRILRSRIKSE